MRLSVAGERTAASTLLEEVAHLQALLHKRNPLAHNKAVR